MASIVLWVFAMKANQKFKSLHKDENAFIDFGHLLGIVGLVLGAILSVIIIGSFFLPFRLAVKGIVENFTGADWGDPTANTISPVLGTVVAFVGLLAIVGLVIVSVALRRGKNIGFK